MRIKVSVVAAGMLMIGLLPTASARTPVTCRAESCTTGETTSISCNFHSNLSHSKPAVNVVHFLQRSYDAEKVEDILQCLWITNSDSPHCIVGKGYVFNNIITDKLTMEVPAATAEFAGLYMCLVISQGDFDSHACELTVEETRDITTLSVNRTTPGVDDGLQCNSSSTGQNAIVAVIVLSVLLCVVMGLCLVIFLRCRRHQAESSVVDKEEERCSTPLMRRPQHEADDTVNYVRDGAAVIYRVSDDRDEICDMIEEYPGKQRHLHNGLQPQQHSRQSRNSPLENVDSDVPKCTWRNRLSLRDNLNKVMKKENTKKGKKQN